MIGPPTAFVSPYLFHVSLCKVSGIKKYFSVVVNCILAVISIAEILSTVIDEMWNMTLLMNYDICLIITPTVMWQLLRLKNGS